MKLLVTGGSGFIGSHLVDLLTGEGHEVVNYDLRDPKYASKAKHAKCDILSLNDLNEHFKGADAVFHLAAEAKVGEFFNQPIISSETNIMGTIKVLEAARTNSVKRVLLASTEWVYSGVKHTDKVDETTNLYPYGPPHLYSASKIAGESACVSYKELYNQNYTVMRFGIPFGERAWADTVTPIFLRKIFAKEPVTLRGKGDQFRQFVYVKDLVKGIYSLLNPAAENQIVNVNGKRPITILEIAETIEKITGIKATKEFIPDRPGDFKGYYVSSEKIKKLTGWAPTTEYMDAMKTYIPWFEKNELKRN